MEDKTTEPKAEEKKPDPKAPPKYIVLSNLHHDGVSYEAGDEVELPEATGAELVELGVVKLKKAGK